MKFFKKWYIYQKERFPILIYGLYIFSIVFAVFCFSNYVTQTNNSECKVYYIKLMPMFIVAFLQFLMIRIIDEFKDYKEDCKYRAYRPVPRGVITLKELGILFVICAILQVIITFIFNRKGLILLVLVWLFSALLSKDFFIKKFIDKHILFGVLLDEILMPILVLYLASYVYVGIDIWPIILISYFVSWTVEIARKVRCKEDEEKGVKTYTAVFGIKKATIILIGLETILMILQIKVLGLSYLILELCIYLFINIFNFLFIKDKTQKMAKIIELLANIYIIKIYFSMVLLIL